MTESKYKPFDPNPGEVWKSSYWDGNNEDEPTVYYFVEKMPPTVPSARFGSSHNTWKVIILEAGSLESIPPSTPSGMMVQRQFDGVSIGYGPDGVDGCDSYDNYYVRLA